MYKIGFILNGKSRRKRRFYRELQKTRNTIRDVEFNVVETSQQGHATNLASEFINEGYTHLIAVGGDGTLHEALNGLMKNYSSEVVLGNYPLGTANDFIKSIAVPQSLNELFQSVRSTKKEIIDIGKIEFDGGIKYFINIADVGIGAEVVKKVNSSSKWLGSNITFTLAILKSFLSYKNILISAKTENWTHEGKIKAFIMANGNYFGSGLCIAPEAQLNNGAFQVVISGNVSVKDYIQHSSMAKKGLRIDHTEIHYNEANNVTIEAAMKCGIEADGEFIGYCPATFSIIPKKINFLIR